MVDYSPLREYCTSEAQLRVVDAAVNSPTIQEAARSLDQSERSIYRALSRIKKHAARRGYSPGHDMTHATPDGFTVKGTSTLYGPEGEIKGQWVKTQQDSDRFEAMREACLAAFEDAKPLPVVAAPKNAAKDLLAVYPLGDPHIGMYVWANECGADFDTDIATKDLKKAVDRLVAIAPAAHTGVLLNLGDFFHSDNMEGKTRRAGNVLDVDTRWARVLQMGVDTMIRLIHRMLEKHKRVIVRNNIGNHDEHSSIMLAIALQAFFRKNKRVEIDTSPSPFWFYRHGEVLIGSTHGDRTKPADLEGIMASDRAKDWGETLYRYWYTGHIHNRKTDEFRGCQVESFRTLAAKDAWHHGEGYRSGRDMWVIIHHAKQGDLERHRIGIEQL